MKTGSSLFILVLIMSMTVELFADLPKNNSPEELERWFNSNEEEWKPQDINEGALQFLTTSPKIKPQRSINHITISAHSLEHGWVTLKQCHSDLDALPAAQILYKKHHVKNISILQSKHIARSWVEGNSVQMKNISANAHICIQADIHALGVDSDGQYTLTTGPYRRKFLDGYFPIDLSLTIDYPDNLKLAATQPLAQAGYKIKKNRHSLTISALFEGELLTQFKFSRQSVTNSPL